MVLGGTRSGKSEVAERLATGWGRPVTYVATGPIPTRPSTRSGRRGLPATASDVPRRGRRSRYPGAPISGPSCEGSAPRRVVDSLGTWIASLEDFGTGGAAVGDLARALVERRTSAGPIVVVSDEVGLGVHPSSELGRRFRDALGTLNAQVAKVADRVLLVVAGRVLPLGRLEEATAQW